ncbi:hypothetical protein BSKO_04102 [Bryopsis sp. KO-2023]|nr:hypothetical protein BSKO_04102 [Bryopsis sp. KO-2023]
MDAFLLTFSNPILEKKYARHRMAQLLKADWSMFCFWFITRSVIMFHAVGSNNFDWSLERYCAFVVFWLLPLLEGLFRRTVQEAWFLRNGTMVHSLQGILQSFLAMRVAASLLSSAENNGMVSALILASGAVIQIFNLWWYAMCFKHHILLSTWTVTVWVLFVMPICTDLLDSMGYTPATQSIACNLNMMFDGLLFCTDGECVKSSVGSGQKLFVFWHVYLYLVVIPCWVWFHERAARVEFLDRLEEGEVETAIPVVERNGSFLELISPMMSALPIAWWTTSAVCDALTKAKASSF